MLVVVGGSQGGSTLFVFVQVLLEKLLELLQAYFTVAVCTDSSQNRVDLLSVQLDSMRKEKLLDIDFRQKPLVVSVDRPERLLHCEVRLPLQVLQQELDPLYHVNFQVKYTEDGLLDRRR